MAVVGIWVPSQIRSVVSRLLLLSAKGARPGLCGDASLPFLVLASRFLARSCTPSLLCFATLLMVMLRSSLTVRLVPTRTLLARITADCSQSVNADLWCEAWRHLERLGGVITRWVKAHAGRQHLAAGLLTFHDRCGNYCADALANRAAGVAQVFPEDAANYLSHVDLAKGVQMRAVTVIR